MPSTYKTPGVYVEEISLFPPSVAAVETAIPAFIGYTGNKDHLNTPIKISSMLQYREAFGGAPPVNIEKLELDALNQVTSLEVKGKFYLYDALRLFYANGGGDCYVICVGDFDNEVVNGESDGSTQGLLTGLKKLEKEDEPTLIVVPDATIMTQENINTLYQQMLLHCSKMQDRFSVFDLKENGDDYDDAVNKFREGIGVNFLNYGAAYTPWLNANLPRSINFQDLEGSLNLETLISSDNKEAAFTIDRITNVLQDIKLFNTESTGITQQKYLEKRQAIIDAANDGDAVAALKALLSTDDTDDALLNGIEKAITELVKNALDKLASYADYDEQLTKGKTYVNDAIENISNNNTSLSNISDFDTASLKTKDSIIAALSKIDKLWSDGFINIDAVNNTLKTIMQQLEDSITAQVPAYKSIKSYIENQLTTLPPSAAMVGIYARTDSTRGVWKAPANESVFTISSLTEKIDFDTQKSLNVDVVAGKSINAIRAFPGKGILVWGARTLAGNDNEWRYVSVRRFFIFAEESIKKATEQFVFEPNDANTWVKVQGMIENFLRTQWQAGALAGATPEEAFFVKVGLNETMTPIDVLEGRMIVEIGMAVVRPAEFIILKFSHKMQES
ncbi:MAG: phage tail sheath C-terminal domain-containing protein [Bacteroidota bacterium]